MVRPSWDELFLGVARAMSGRADCTRRKVGAVIVKDNRVVGAGYNGAPPGEPGCLTDGACPRGQHYARYANDTFDLECGCGGPWPCPDVVEPGSSYETGPGKCVAVHAEINAIMFSDWQARQGATMYSTDAPCDGCRTLIRGSGILRAVWPEGSEEFGNAHGRQPASGGQPGRGARA